jgi:DNA modification methylase
VKDLKLKIEYWPIEKLLPYARNPRKNDHAVERGASFIKEFGFSVPVLVQSDGTIIDGHLRLKCAKRLGMKEVPVTVRDDMTEAQIKAFRLSVNRFAELADWDDEMLKIELMELDNLQYDIDLLGFDVKLDGENSGTEGLTDPDEVPEVPQNVFGVKRGDVWLLGNHRLMCGDSTSEDDVNKLMNGKRAVFCFTSPPYADMREYNGGKELSTKHLAKFLDAPCDLFAVNLGIQRKDNEIVQYWDDYIQAAKQYGHKFLSWNIWDRNYPASIAQQTAIFAIEHEWIFIFGKSRIELNKTIPNKNAGQKMCGKSTNRESDGRMFGRANEIVHDNRRMGTIIRVDIYRGNSMHPAMFPVELPETYYQACTNENDSVYEPFCGSGTSIIAAEKTGRICYGMELDEHYCGVIIKRWQDFTGKTAIKEETNG